MLYPQPGLIQSAFAEVSTNISTTSTTYVDMTPLTLTLDTAANFLLVDFTACVEIVSSLGDLGFQLLLDGVVQVGAKGRIAASGSPGYTSCPSIRFRTPTRVSAGSHTIKMQWKTSASTVQIRAATFVYATGSLLVREVSV